MATNEEQVSREAFDRVKGENSQMKAQLEQATAALADVQLRDKAYAVLSKNPAVKDPYTAAMSALPHIRGVEEDQFEAKVNSFLEQQMRLFGVNPNPPSDDGDGDGSTPPPVTSTPPLVPAPNPGADGAPPAPKVYKWNDPEIQELRQKGANEELSRMVDNGSLLLSPNNPYAKTPASGR